MSSASIPFVRTSALMPFVGYFNAIGVPIQRWRRQANIPETLLDDPEGLVPLHSAYRFVELTARKEGLEDVGRIVGHRTSAFALGVFGKALSGTTTIQDYLATGIRLISELSSSGTRMWLTSERDLLRVNQHIAGPAGIGRCIADVYTLTITVRMLREFIGETWSPGEVRLLTGSEALLGDPLCFGDSPIIPGQSRSSFTLSRSLATLPTSRRPAGAPSSTDALTTGVAPIPTEFVSSLRQVIVSLAGDGYPDLAVAAQAAGLSPRTLQRRLLQAGTSYNRLIADTRIELAREWLSDSRLPVAEIAATLGYTDASNFSRAFRRQTGLSPGAYRRVSADTPYAARREEG